MQLNSHFSKNYFNSVDALGTGIKALLTAFLLGVTLGCSGVGTLVMEELPLQEGLSTPPTNDEVVSPPENSGTQGSGGISGAFTKTFEGRSYKVFIPPSYDSATPTSVVVAFHGLGDNFVNFEATFRYYGWHTSSEKNNFIIIVPDHKNSARESFIHFSSNGQLDAEATIIEMDEVLDLVYYGVGADYNVDKDRIYWTGFSEGAVFVTLAASALSNELRAVVPYAGAAGRSDTRIQRLVPIYFLAGTSDYNYSGIVQAAEGWADGGNTVKTGWVNASHSFGGISNSVSAESVWQWMQSVNAPAVEDSY